MVAATVALGNSSVSATWQGYVKIIDFGAWVAQ
jgi:hypothetical protein